MKYVVEVTTRGASFVRPANSLSEAVRMCSDLEVHGNRVAAVCPGTDWAPDTNALSESLVFAAGRASQAGNKDLRDLLYVEAAKASEVAQVLLRAAEQL